MFLKILIFKMLYFSKLCPIFVGSVHNFGKSEDLMKKYLFPLYALVVWCPTWSKNLGRSPIFLIFFSVNNIKLGDQLLLMKFFETLIFKALYLLKMCPIFVGSVHNFSKSDDDIISNRCTLVVWCPTWSKNLGRTLV